MSCWICPVVTVLARQSVCVENTCFNKDSSETSFVATCNIREWIIAYHIVTTNLDALFIGSLLELLMCEVECGFVRLAVLLDLHIISISLLEN